MADEKNTAAAGDAATVTLERVNTAPAQTWNRLRANDITLTVPSLSRKGDVYFALPQLFGKMECGMGEAVTGWATSQAADARYVEVQRNTVREEPIVVDIDADAGNVADTGVMVREGACATIVVAVHGGEKASAGAKTSGSLLRVVAEARANVTIIEVLGVAAEQQHLESVGITADEDAHVEVRQYALGGGTVAMGLAAELAGARSRIDLTCRYFAHDKNVLDINHVVRMRGRNTRAEVSESGALDGAARKSLRATIDLVHGARGAKGNEAESVLVLGDDVVNKTVPTILCDEDDVAGNHGATIGSVSPEQIDYLMDRGLSRHEAEQLFVRAIFEDAIMHAPEAASHKAAVLRAEEVLGADVAHDFDEGAEPAKGTVPFAGGEEE
ncbi:SufD family Fe-S cluster assembly protein [Paratractidigestivibacter sp.]|uniref:SufB/SufD family protein n=1 Tax=Paratractidigestivibacter sp. TaxID=2847316 RepID=UPI002AC8EA0A|nr:SufD family Fe-S cluster assembly protein [Paratractidigestivibacter sp.]